MGEMKTKIEGDVRFDPRVDYSEVEEITGTLDCRGADTKASFPKLSTVDGTYAHGDTVAEAREALLYKVGQRDTIAYSGWTLDRKITGRQAVESYRVITGACEAGVRQFVTTHLGKLAARYTVREVIDLTRGQYGNERYAAFFAARTDVKEGCAGAAEAIAVITAAAQDFERRA
jgi:hypothetical protein